MNRCMTHPLLLVEQKYYINGHSVALFCLVYECIEREYNNDLTQTSCCDRLFVSSAYIHVTL